MLNKCLDPHCKQIKNEQKPLAFLSPGQRGKLVQNRWWPEDEKASGGIGNKAGKEVCMKECIFYQGTCRGEPGRTPDCNRPGAGPENICGKGKGRLDGRYHI